MVVTHCMLAVGISVLLVAFIFSNMLLRVSMDTNKIFSLKCLYLGSEIFINSRLHD